MDRRAHQFSGPLNALGRSRGRKPLILPFRVLVALTAMFAIGLVQPAVAQELATVAEAAKIAKPSAQDGVVARLVATLMPRNHISAEKLNDTISKRALDLFIDTLDPLKLYFLQSDIDEFNKNATKIDDMVRVGDLSLAYEIFNRFTQRVDQRVADAQKMLDGDFDFNKVENIIVDPEAAQYAANESERVTAGVGKSSTPCWTSRTTKKRVTKRSINSADVTTDMQSVGKKRRVTTFWKCI